MGGAPITQSSATWRTIALVTAVATLLVLAAGCAGTTQPPEVPVGASTSADPLRTAAIDVCVQFTRLALSTDTQLDRGPAAARVRAAAQYGTPGLAQQLAGEGRDQDWATLAAHHAHVLVDTTPVADDPSPIEEGQAGAGVTASRTAVGAAGWRQPLPAIVAYCSLARRTDGWKITAVTFSDAGLTESRR
jgi:hypothetical protein